MSVEFYENYCKSNKIPVDQNILTALGRSLTTREVSLAGITISAQNCEALGAAIQAYEGVNKIDLSNSLLPLPGLCALIDKLTNCHLNVLNLKGNNIYGNATLKLTRLVSKNSSLKVLLLEWNNLGSPLQAFSQFCYALMNNRTLEVLDLKSNELNSECAPELADVILHNTSLRDIDLRWNSIGPGGGQILLEALSSNNTLGVLRVQGNGIPSDIINAIDNTVKRNCTLQKISCEYAARQDMLTKQIQSINQKRIEDFKSACEQGIQQLQPCLDKIKEYSVEKRKLIEQIEQSKVKIMNLEELVTGLRFQLDGANKQIDSKQVLICEQEKTITSIREQYEADIEAIKARFAKEENKLRSEIESFQTIIENEKSQREALEKKLRESQLSVETMLKETEELKGRVSNVTSMHNKVLEEERRMHKESLDQMFEELKCQQAQASELLDKVKRENNEKIEILEKKLDESEKSKQALNDVLLAERCKWNEEKSIILTEASEKQAELVVSINKQLNEVKEEKAKVEEELSRSQASVKTLLRENEAMKSEATEYMSRILLLQNQLSESKMMLDKIQREQSKATKLDDALKEEADKYKTELMQARRTISDLEMEKNNLVEKHRKEVIELNNKLQDKIEEISKIRAEEIEKAQALFAAINKYIGGK